MITDIRLQNFRSYSDDSFEFDNGVNIIVGPNAAGKTNLLESILVLARGSSYRVKDADLITFSQPWARLDGNLHNGELRTVKIITEPRPVKTYEFDGKVYKRLTQQHMVPIVLFEPNHLQLLSGSPERRRDYLDDLLEQVVGNYGPLRRQYRRTLAQRNALLKQNAPHLQEQLFPWNIRISQLAGQIVRARVRLINEINTQITGLYNALSGGTVKVRVQYESKWPDEQYESQLLQKLENDLQLDILRGFTGAGPHRDDMTTLFNDRPAVETASRGETRTAVLALKIIELQIIKNTREVTPLLLLDDVFSELDGKRRHALTDYLAPYQTFITTTEADIVVKHFTQSCRIVPLG
jgi:DNA replication and repair protein RecF